MASSYILAIDQGTSSTKAILFDEHGSVVKKASAALHTNYLSGRWVEQDPDAILESVREAIAKCLKDIPTGAIKCIGISNQRETFVLWDNKGRPVHPAIVWSCKRSIQICETLKDQEAWLSEKTGLKVDPYFSGTKLLWLLEHRPQIADRVAKGELFFGTVDTWLLFHLTNGVSYFTDHSNASRTLLCNVKDLEWDPDIIQKWNLGGLRLPKIKASSDDFGETDIFGSLPVPVPITAMIGDSHAAMFGETCFEQGDIKMTLGTGSSLLMHIGPRPKASKNGLLTTIGWSTKEEVAYAWEGAIVACGSMVEWLKSIHIITNAGETAALALSVGEPSDVYLIPAFSGLGAPFWQMGQKASFHGMTFGTTKAHLVKATLESICYQIKAVLDAMQADLERPIPRMAMHGGLANNEFVQKCLRTLLDGDITLQENLDISAQGAAFLAGLKAGIFKDRASIRKLLTLRPLPKEQECNELAKKYEYWLHLVDTLPHL